MEYIESVLQGQGWEIDIFFRWQLITIPTQNQPYSSSIPREQCLGLEFHVGLFLTSWARLASGGYQLSKYQQEEQLTKPHLRMLSKLGKKQ